MPYEEFSTFNRCSKSSKEICENLPPRVKLPMDVIYIHMNTDDTKIFVDKIQAEKDMDVVPSHVKLTTYKTQLLRLDCFDIYRKHLIQTNRLLVEPYLEDPDYVQQLLTITKPNFFEGKVTSEVLLIPAFQEVPSMELICDEVCDDNFLLDLKGHDLVFRGEISATQATIEKMIEQWIQGERNITRIHVNSPDFDIFYFRRNMEGQFTLTGSRNHLTLFVCRSAEHKKCLSIKLVRGCVYIESISLTNFKCPNAFESPTNPIRRRGSL